MKSGHVRAGRREGCGRGVLKEVGISPPATERQPREGPGLKQRREPFRPQPIPVAAQKPLPIVIASPLLFP